MPSAPWACEARIKSSSATSKAAHKLIRSLEGTVARSLRTQPCTNKVRVKAMMEMMQPANEMRLSAVEWAVLADAQADPEGS